jgi:DNA-binding transcriptional MerR regulator
VVRWATSRHDRAMEELLTVAAVARRIGVAPATLRTWARRYGLGPSGHEAGDHRKYCASDLAKLTLMRRLISAGVAPADAAEQALTHKGEVKVEKILKSFEVREDVVSAIVKAANSLDRKFVEAILRRDIEKYGVIDSWQEVMVPVLVIVGDAWAATGDGIEVEHLLSETIIGILRDRTKQLKSPINTRPVLIASVGEEFHSLAIHALHAALAEAKVECNFLGARTPLSALSSMISRSAPPAVFLWAQLPKNADPKYFREIPSVRPSPRVILGGPGWDRSECSDMPFADDLTLACEQIKQAIGA